VNGKILDRSDLDALLRTEERFAATH
jgi:hypothetical protein